jgi:hypothetical protein
MLSSSFLQQHGLSKRPKVSILNDLLLATAQRSIHYHRSQLIYLDTPAQAHQHTGHIVLFRQYKPWSANERLKHVRTLRAKFQEPIFGLTLTLSVRNERVCICSPVLERSTYLESSQVSAEPQCLSLVPLD